MKKKPIPEIAPPNSSSVSKPSQNRTAFMLGLYVELPAVDAVVEPLVHLSVMLSIPKLTLLDHAISRLGEYDVERSMLPTKDSLNWESLEYADKRRCHALDFLYHAEHEKIRTIAGLLWEGQTELAAWYHAGKAIGIVVKMCDSGHGLPSKEAVAFAKACLNQAASHWRKEIHLESGGGLVVWLSQWDSNFKTEDTAVGKMKRKAVKPKDVEPAAPKVKVPENKGLRAVETLAVQIQDRPDDTRSYEQRKRDARDQFIYEKFFAGFDAAEIRELLRQKNKDENLEWPSIQSKNDLRAIANNYAVSSHKAPIPAGKPGRPAVRNRK